MGVCGFTGTTARTLAANLKSQDETVTVVAGTFLSRFFNRLFQCAMCRWLLAVPAANHGLPIVIQPYCAIFLDPLSMVTSLFPAVSGTGKRTWFVVTSSLDNSEVFIQVSRVSLANGPE